MKKSYTVPKPEWWKHLRKEKKTFWKRQRVADAKNAKSQSSESIPNSEGMIKIQYMPSTDNKDMLGKGRGNSCEVSLHEFYQIIEWFVCDSCKANICDIYAFGDTDIPVPAETIGDLLDSACACELWIEDPLNLIDDMRPIGGFEKQEQQS